MDINLSNFYYSSSVSGTGGNRTITFFTTGSSTIGTLPDSVGNTFPTWGYYADDFNWALWENDMIASDGFC